MLSTQLSAFNLQLSWVKTPQGLYRCTFVALNCIDALTHWNLGTKSSLLAAWRHPDKMFLRSTCNGRCVQTFRPVLIYKHIQVQQNAEYSLQSLANSSIFNSCFETSHSWNFKAILESHLFTFSGTLRVLLYSYSMHVLICCWMLKQHCM